MKQTNTYGLTLDLAVLAPTVQASNIVYSPGLSFTRGNGSRALVIVSRNPITKLPKDGVHYPVGYCFPDGSFVIARTNSNAVDFTTEGTWYVRVFEFNGYAGTERYNRSEATNNPITFSSGSTPLTVDADTITVDSDIITADQTIN